MRKCALPLPHVKLKAYIFVPNFQRNFQINFKLNQLYSMNFFHLLARGVMVRVDHFLILC